jgi:hypothetical protein
MGAVYRAVDPLIEREVAIKTLLPNLPPELMEEVRERFIREARSAGRLNHPNIVTIFDVGEHDGMAYIAMELLDGQSLQEVLRGERLPFHDTAELAAQVADALDLAQQYKIVHRDVKPANIMVGSNGRAKLTDFGVARIDSSSMTQTGAALGSPKYMSPEQVLGQPTDPRSDIFSLGVVLYEMLVKRTPFERPTDTTVFTLMNRIAGEPHVPVRKVDAQVPEAFEHILRRALEKNPEQRYARGSDMAKDLRNFRNLEAGTGSAPAAGGYEKTVFAGRPAPSPAVATDEKVATQLITDLDKFTREFEREEQARVRAEEEARLRKEEEIRKWGEEEERRRDEFERTRLGGGIGSGSGGASGGAPTDPAATTSGRRAGALDFLKQQAASQTVRENPAIAREKAVTALDKALRSAYQYLAEVVKEMNALLPTSPRPYEFMYVGKLPSVALSDGWVDSRPLHIPGKDVCERVMMRYRVTPTTPAKFSLLGEDIARCIQYLKMMKVEYKPQAEARNDFGKVTKALFTVTGSLPCEIIVRGDYENPGVIVELLNVRRIGRSECRLAPEQLDDVTDDLARYVLGVDDDFARLLKK